YNVPAAFQPGKVPYGLIDINQIYATGHGRDIFAEREISRDCAIVVVRPDQYVAGVLPLDAREQLVRFFANNMIEAEETAPAEYINDLEIAERAALAIHVED